MISAAKGGAILIAALLITFFLNYFFNVALGWLLTPEQYGIYGVSLAMLMILTLFINSGFPWAAAKFLSEDTKEEIKYRVFKSSLIGNFLVATIISLLFYAIYVVFLPLEEAYFSLILMIIAVTFIFSIKFPYFRALQGFFKFKEMGMIGVLEVFLKLLVGIGLVYLGYGVVGALTGFLVGGLLTLIIMIYLLRGFKFWKSKEWMDFKVFSFALPMFFGALGITLIQNLDILGIKFLTERVISNELAGYYQAALILARIPLFVVGVIMMAIFPFISKYSRSGSEVYSSTSLRFALLFIFPVTLAIALIPEAFIKLIFPEVYTVGAQALAVVAIGMGFLAIILVLAQIFQALGKPRLPAIILMVTVLLQIIFLLILTPKFGLVGAALSTTLACLFGMAWLAQSYRKIYGLSLDINKALRLFAAFGIAAVSLVLFPHHTRIFTLLDLTLAGAAYLVALALFGLISGSDVDIIAGSMKNERARRVCDAIKNFVVRLNGVLKWRSV